MTIKLTSLLVSALFSFPLFAHTWSDVTYKCPLDGTDVETTMVFSGTVFGTRLDFKKVGPCITPYPMGQCPECGFPLYNEKEDSKLTAEEIEQLKTLVASERFQKEAKGKSAYFAFGVLQELQDKPAYDIAWTYLQASWENEEAPLYKENKEVYAEAAKRAITFFDLAAKNFRDTRENPDELTAAYSIMLYLPVELSRRIGDFEAAAQRLADAAPLLADSPVEGMSQALNRQKQLIADKDATPH